MKGVSTISLISYLPPPNGLRIVVAACVLHPFLLPPLVSLPKLGEAEFSFGVKFTCVPRRFGPLSLFLFFLSWPYMALFSLDCFLQVVSSLCQRLADHAFGLPLCVLFFLSFRPFFLRCPLPLVSPLS